MVVNNASTISQVAVNCKIRTFCFCKVGPTTNIGEIQRDSQLGSLQYAWKWGAP